MLARTASLRDALLFQEPGLLIAEIKKGISAADGSD
jgi:hypothetical protein